MVKRLLIIVFQSLLYLSASNTFPFHVLFSYITELNDLKIIICFRISEVIVERVSVCNVP